MLWAGDEAALEGAAPRRLLHRARGFHCNRRRGSGALQRVPD